MADISPVTLCKAIRQNLSFLPQEDQDEITRTYRLTHQVVVLWSSKLATPTKAAAARLRDLYEATERARAANMGRVMRPLIEAQIKKDLAARQAGPDDATLAALATPAAELGKAD